MIKDIQVRHHEYATMQSFEEVVTSFENVVGTLEDIGWAAIPAASKDLADFEARVKETLGPSGFARFLTLDHGAWLTIIGQRENARLYTIGNPLIALTMLCHDLRAGLNVPVRLIIYQHQASGTTRLAYDQPSSLMSAFENRAVTEAAEALDAKLAALAEQVTGSKA